MAWSAANLTGGEAEELRKAMGGKRADGILAGMTVAAHRRHDTKGIMPEMQTKILQYPRHGQGVHVPRVPRAQLCFACVFECLYAVSLPGGVHLRVAQQSADGVLLRRQRSLNDAKRHGLKFWPIDVQHSEWNCTLEALSESDRSKHSDPFAVRVGFRYIKGLRQETGDAIAAARKDDGPFASEYDLKRRVPSIRKTGADAAGRRQEPSTGREKSMIAARLSGARNAPGRA